LALAKDSPLTRSVQAIDSILPLPVLGGCAAADQLALGQVRRAARSDMRHRRNMQAEIPTKSTFEGEN